MDNHGVGDAAGHGKGARPLGGHDQGNLVVGPFHVYGPALVIDGLAGKQCSHGLHVFVEVGQFGRTQSQVQNGAVAAADAEVGAASGEPVDGRDARGRHGRVPGQGVGHRGSQMHAFGGAGNDSQAHVQLGPQ